VNETNESIELHTIGLFRGKEYEMQDLLNGLLEENSKLNNKLLRIKKLISRTPRQTSKEKAYVMLKGEIAEVIEEGK